MICFYVIIIIRIATFSIDVLEREEFESDLSDNMFIRISMIVLYMGKAAVPAQS
jgi:hypothetical protein